MASMCKNMNECVPTDRVSVCTRRNPGGERTQESLTGVPVNTHVTLATGGYSQHRAEATPPRPCLRTSKGAQVSLQERTAPRAELDVSLIEIVSPIGQAFRR